MFGKWWVERLERQAVEAKLDEFTASLDADERCWLNVIMADRYRRERDAVDAQRLTSAFELQRMQAQAPVQGLQDYTQYPSLIGDVLGGIWPR